MQRGEIIDIPHNTMKRETEIDGYRVGTLTEVWLLGIAVAGFGEIASGDALHLNRMGPCC